MPNLQRRKLRHGKMKSSAQAYRAGYRSSPGQLSFQHPVSHIRDTREAKILSYPSLKGILVRKARPHQKKPYCGIKLSSLTRQLQS